MSLTTLIVLTVVEAVVLVAALAVYLVLLTRRLTSISDSLSKVAWGVRAVEVEVEAVGPAVGRVNGLLRELTEDLLPAVAARSGELADRASAPGGQS
ncbi:MAG: hypothetical protein ACLGIR_08605 [Actinomycetes bacterium]|jgi:uncharacterized protein YoxC